MGKNKIILILSVFLSIILAGCSVASEKEIVRFAKDKYGEATLIKTDDSDKEVKCYFKDKEYGFEYYVTSYMNDIIIDGSKFGATENKGSNFDIQYYNYLNDAVKDDLALLEKKYNIKITVSDGTYIYYFAKINYIYADTTNVALVSKEVSDLYTNLDTRHYWKNLDVEAYDANGTYLGAYHYEHSKWMNPEEEVDLLYIERINDLNPNATYVRKEQHPFNYTGVNINDVVSVLGNPEVKVDSIINCYIFTVDGKEYYMCDFMIVNDIGGYEWYTNYKE